MKRDTKLFVEDILECINKIEKYIKEFDESTFYQNAQIQDAVIRRSEIIGEATKNIPNELKQQANEIQWEEMAGMRNVITHGYFGINLERIWETATQDIPKLKPQILKLLETFKP